MDKYKLIKDKISSNSNVVDFREFGDGTTLEWIEKAESYLNVKFPPTYIWWLTNYGGGEIYGEEIFSIYEIDFDQVVGGDIVKMNMIYRERGFNNNQIVISTTDRGEIFFFDSNLSDEEGEYPVFLNITKEKYADDFISFLNKRINNSNA